MADKFEYDVFLSHASADKAAVRELAQPTCEHRILNIQRRTFSNSSLRRSMFDVGRSMFNAAAFASEWVTLERHTALFRDPTNQQRRFIPLRLDDCDIKGSLKHYAYIDWRFKQDREYIRLLKVCRSGNLQKRRENAEVDDPAPVDNSDADGDGGDAAVTTTTDTMQIDIVIDRDFDSYSAEEQKRVLAAIEQFLGVCGEIRVTQKRRGSVKLRLELPPELAERLLWAAKQGEFSNLGVINANLIEETDQQQPTDTVGESPQPQPGSRFGHYEFRELLGKGREGEVFLARDTALDRYVAIKLIRSEPTAIERFAPEARLLATINHPNVVRIYEVGQMQEGLIYVSMEYIDGQSLNEIMRERPLSIPESTRIVISVAEAVADLHSRGFVHRDISPSHIIVDSNDNPRLIVGPLATLRSSEMPDTSPYASPEERAGAPVGASSDVWAIGMVLYELLSGQRSGPLPIRPLSTLDRRIPMELDHVCMTALRESPEDRYPSARELVYALRQATIVMSKMSFMPKLKNWLGMGKKKK